MISFVFTMLWGYALAICFLVLFFVARRTASETRHTGLRDIGIGFGVMFFAEILVSIASSVSIALDLKVASSVVSTTLAFEVILFVLGTFCVLHGIRKMGVTLSAS